MNEGLENFLAGKAGQEAAVQAPPVAAAEPPEPASAEPTVAVITSPAEPPDDDEAVAPSRDGRVPVQALQAARAKRNDYKEQSIRAQEQAKAADERAKSLEAQLAEAMKARAAPPPPSAPAAPAPRVQMPDPAEDPIGFELLQQRMNVSEELLRDKEGDEAVDKAIETFKEMRAKDPLLQDRLISQRNPYKWLFSEIKKARAVEAVGTDLDAYNTKLKEQYRAEWEAERAAQPVASVSAPHAAVVLPRSLANATSSAPRSAVAWSGPTPFSEILKR